MLDLPHDPKAPKFNIDVALSMPADPSVNSYCAQLEGVKPDPLIKSDRIPESDITQFHDPESEVTYAHGRVNISVHDNKKLSVKKSQEHIYNMCTRGDAKGKS